MKQQRIKYWKRVKYWNYGIRWYFNNKLHRDGDLPATYCFENEKIVVVYYCQNGKYHRTTGPAYINYKRKIKWYWYQDKQYGSFGEIQMVKACK